GGQVRFANTRSKQRRGVERLIKATTVAAGTVLGSLFSASAEPNAFDRERLRKPAAGDVTQATAPAVADDFLRFAAPESATLDGLRWVGLSDLEDYKSRISAGNQMGFGYYFPYLLARNGAEDLFLGQEEGSVCVFVRRDWPSGPHLDLFLAPAPMNSKA